MTYASSNHLGETRLSIQTLRESGFQNKIVFYDLGIANSAVACEFESCSDKNGSISEKRTELSLQSRSAHFQFLCLSQLRQKSSYLHIQGINHRGKFSVFCCYYLILYTLNFSQ